MPTVWDEIEQKLVQLYSLPHNQTDLASRNLTPQQAAQKKLTEIKAGLFSATPEDYVGPKLFLRVVGPANRTYSGEWWFEASLLDDLEKAYSRIYFTAPEKKAVIRDMLREAMAVATEWNPMLEIWALELPAGQILRGYWGPGTPQQLFANQPLTAKGNRMLVGKARQVYFPVKNPLWVQKYQDLA
jgi:hypothetical protein